MKLHVLLDAFKYLARHLAFGMPGITIVGMVCNAEGRWPEQKKVQKIVDWPAPRNIKEARGFVGIAVYHASTVRIGLLWSGERCWQTAVPTNQFSIATMESPKIAFACAKVITCLDKCVAEETRELGSISLYDLKSIKGGNSASTKPSTNEQRSFPGITFQSASPNSPTASPKSHPQMVTSNCSTYL